ncbi:MAG: bifunctional methylenetetrahydrofolate dehydrogenase/methenyltetrahydrofolate cyclohydrolase [Alphaproteobacteria bacterium]|nr:MAG: bifunctional methylenetetrahydrofolate dehydrogenase/methenyltetrahydrofolate cyclohydrolase [Alphaproteobacteria bacterium]
MTITARIIDGKRHADIIKSALKDQIQAENLTPSLHVILIGDDPASKIYVKHKKQACEKIGIDGHIHNLSVDTTQSDVTNLIQTLNEDMDVSGILIQLPLPDHLNTHEILNTIDPAKDVDGLTVTNVGKLVSGVPHLVPCTPQGVMELLKFECKDLSGKNAVLIGRSLLFGKPMAHLLMMENCTVTQCHSKTENIADICARGDILISAVGQSKMVKEHWVKDGAIVIDVGISRDSDGKISGDVDFDTVKNKAAAITPVPGGVGPMTVACLLRNTVKASL